MRTRPFPAIIVFLMVTIGVVVPLAVQGVVAQDEGTPPLIEPSDSEGQGGGGVLETNFELGAGGQPEDFPREITVDGARFLFDRMVSTSRQELVPVASEAEIQAFATTETAPFDAIYLSVPPRNEDELGRYLPQHLDTPDIACPAEAVNVGSLDAGGTPYAFAGLEMDLTPDVLQEVGSSEGRSIYADPNVEQPFPELFVAAEEGLLRFVVTAGDGRPSPIAESLAFQGELLAFTGDVTDQISSETLTKIGCAGAWPVFVDQGDATSANRYVRVGDRLFQFIGEAAPVDPPTEMATEAPTEIPTEAPTMAPTEAPTEIPTEAPTMAPTEAPTESPTEAPTVAPTEAPTEAPTATTEPPAEAPTATPEPATEVPAATEEAEGEDAAAVPTIAVPAEIVDAATGADAPPQVEVNDTTYYFARTDVDIDISTLVEVDVITINNIELTVYAEQALNGVASVLYCVDNDGRLVGEYVPAAQSEPQPPAQLPPSINVNNTTYVFNEVEVDINVQNLTQVEVTTVQNIEVTIYMEQGIQGQPTRYYAVASDGQVVGQYVSVTVTQVTAQPTQQLQPPAVVPTQAPDAPPPAAVTAEAQPTCDGNPGPINAQGFPTYLPNRIQIGGVSYALVGPESPADAGTLTRITCIGAFEVASTDRADRAEVLYLRYLGGGEAGQSVYRFEAATTYGVVFEVTGNAQRIQAGEQIFRLSAVWTKTIHTSGSVNLFVSNPDEQSPEVYYGVNVANTVVGDVIGEYRKAEMDAAPEEDMVAAGERYGLHADLTVRGQRYLLVNVFLPVGTTTNGFLTLFSATGEGETELLLGRDKRDLELYIYEPIPQETGG